MIFQFAWSFRTKHSEGPLRAQQFVERLVLALGCCLLRHSPQPSPASLPPALGGGCLGTAAWSPFSGKSHSSLLPGPLPRTLFTLQAPLRDLPLSLPVLQAMKLINSTDWVFAKSREGRLLTLEFSDFLPWQNSWGSGCSKRKKEKRRKE